MYRTPVSILTSHTAFTSTAPLRRRARALTVATAHAATAQARKWVAVRVARRLAPDNGVANAAVLRERVRAAVLILRFARTIA